MRCLARCLAVLILLLVASTEQYSHAQTNVGDSDDIRPSEARRRYGPLEVVAESIFGSGTDEPFTPLLLRDLLTDGWDDPWIAPPADSNMPVRQGWVNSADGLFFRNLVWVYQNTQSYPGDRNSNFGLFQFQSPLSRRLWISIDVPFVNSLSSSATGFGDLNLTPRVMLHESRRLSVITGLGIRTPTGQLSTLTGLARLDPNVQFWADLGRRVSMRAGTGLDIPLNNFDLLPTNILTQIALGQTITGHDVPIIGDFQYYLSANLRNFTSTSTPTFFSLTPGFRTHLGGEYYLAGGIEFPLAQPHPYGDRLTFFIARGF